MALSPAGGQLLLHDQDMRACMCMCLYACTSVGMHICMRAYVCACTYTCVCVCVCILSHFSLRAALRSLVLAVVLYEYYRNWEARASEGN